MDRWLVVYDTPDDARRRRLASLLDNHGDRVQDSVFEVRLTPAALEWLLVRLRAIADDDADSLRLYPACAACAKRVICVTKLGPQPWWEPKVYIV